MNNHVRFHVPNEVDKFTEKEMLSESVYACESVYTSVYHKDNVQTAFLEGLYQFTSSPAGALPHSLLNEGGLAANGTAGRFGLHTYTCAVPPSV